MNIVIEDIETYAELFLVVIYIPEERLYKKWEVSKWRNELDGFARFVEQYSDYYFVTYNGLSFDAQVIEWVLRNYEEWYELSGLEIAAKIAQWASDRINDANYDIFPPYREEELSLKQIDLFTIWHFNNRAKSMSLKALEFFLRLNNIEETPVSFNKRDLTREDVVEVTRYCKNDVLATYQFFLFTIGETSHPLYKGKNKILDRQILEEEIGMRCLNWDDVRIGAEWNKLDYLKLTGRNERDLKPKRVNHFYGKKYKQFFPRTVEFQTPKLREYVRKFGETFILNKKQEFPYKFSDSLIANVARGGIHSQEKGRFLQPSSDEIYLQCDIGSQYPNALRKYKVYPIHLGKEWNDMLVSKIQRRLHYKALYKDTKEAKYASLQEMGKLSLNGGAYGRLNLKGDWQEDPCAMLKVTIGCQLEILMITEALILKGFNIVSLNTDGFDAIIPKDREKEFKEICTFYEEKIGNSEMGQIEYTEFLWIAQTSVNDYLAMKTSGELKAKGDFEIFKEAHKNPSATIVPIAIQEYFKNGKSIEEVIKTPNYKYIFDKDGESIELETNIYDFAIRQKASRDFHYEGIDDKGNKNIYNKLIRYYVSKTGEKLFKVKNPECTTNAAPISQVEAGHWKMCVCNHLTKDHPMNNIDFSYYMEKAQKIIDKVIYEGRKQKKECKDQLSLF